MSEQAEQANAVARNLAGGRVDAESTGVAAGSESPVPKTVPYVRLPGGNYLLSQTAREIGSILKTNGIFRRDDLIVTIDKARGGWKPMDAQCFRTYVEDYMLPGIIRGLDETTGKPLWQTKTMKKEDAAGVLQSRAFIDQQRPLLRVNAVPMPVWRESGAGAGKIELLQPGYDVDAKIYTLASDIKVREDMPLNEAVALLRNLYSEFPFGDRQESGTSRSEAVCIASLVSLFGAGLLSQKQSRLHFVMTANAIGSGKSLLAKIPLVTVTGMAKVSLKGDNSEELRKALATAALDGESYLFLDDLDGVLKSQELNAFMTSSTVSGRMMGGMTGFVAEKQCVVFITGNNLKLSSDIERRTLRVSLFTDNFDPQDRTVKNPIDEEWLSQPSVRGDVLSALWALIREWDKAGRPPAPSALRGFEKWCAVFGGIVHHAGFGDPCQPAPRDDNSGSNEMADMETLVQVLRDDIGEGRKKEFTFQDLVDACHENDCFTWTMDGTWKRDKDTGEEWLELNQKSKSALGRMFSEKFGGVIVRLKGGERVRFGHRGKNRHRKYTVEVLPDESRK